MTPNATITTDPRRDALVSGTPSGPTAVSWAASWKNSGRFRSAWYRSRGVIISLARQQKRAVTVTTALDNGNQPLVGLILDWGQRNAQGCNGGITGCGIGELGAVGHCGTVQPYAEAQGLAAYVQRSTTLQLLGDCAGRCTLDDNF